MIMPDVPAHLVEAGAEALRAELRKPAPRRFTGHEPSNRLATAVLGALVGAEIFIVIEEDRHTDTEPYPFLSEEGALDFARELVQKNCRHPELLEEPDAYELSDGAKAEGWIFNCRYGVEGDSIRVMKKALAL